MPAGDVRRGKAPDGTPTRKAEAVMSTVVEVETRVGRSTEDARVYQWRSEQFAHLGFSEEMALLLAGSPADLSRGRALVAAGCPLDLVAQIVL
jgi:hypothetical protein